MDFIILFISGAEVFVVMLVVLLLFGAKKIPELAKGLGKGMNEFKRATDDIKREINENETLQDIKDSTQDVANDINEFKDQMKPKL